MDWAYVTATVGGVAILIAWGWVVAIAFRRSPAWRWWAPLFWPFYAGLPRSPGGGRTNWSRPRIRGTEFRVQLARRPTESVERGQPGPIRKHALGWHCFQGRRLARLI